MPIDNLMWVVLMVTSVTISALWIGVIGLCNESRLLKRGLNALLNALPENLTSTITRLAQQSVPEQSPSEWLLHRILVVLTILLIVSLPIGSLIKLSVLLPLAIVVIERRNRRQVYLKKVLRQWPSALDMVAMLMHSGLSFRAALHALQNIPNDLSAATEISRLHRLQQSGYSLHQAVDGLSHRIPHPWISLFAGAVLQAHQTGGALANTLKVQANQFRQQQLLEAEKRAQEVSVKLMLPLIFCFFPVTMLLILGPVFIGFTQGGVI